MSNRPGLFQAFGGARLRSVGLPVDLDDAVTKRFIRYDWPTGCVGKPAAGEFFPYLVVPTNFTLLSGLPGSQARALTGPAANAVWTLNRIPVGSTTVSQIATLTFVASSKIGSFSMASDLNLTVGDFLYWTAPSTQDSSLSDVGILVAGVR
jgi:hypothetical protein